MSIEIVAKVAMSSAAALTTTTIARMKCVAAESVCDDTGVTVTKL